MAKSACTGGVGKPIFTLTFAVVNIFFGSIPIGSVSNVQQYSPVDKIHPAFFMRSPVNATSFLRGYCWKPIFTKRTSYCSCIIVLYIAYCTAAKEYELQSGHK